jgi:PAS domain S-box-containing protein
MASPMESEGLGTAAELHLQRVLDTASDAYVVVDLDGAVTEWNAAASSTFGWSREEAVGKKLVDLIVPPELADTHHNGFERYQETGIPTILGRVVEVPARHRLGHTFPVEITVWEVAEGGLRGFHAFLRDISERRSAESQLRRTNEDLQAFAAMAAHDLRSPLAIISTYAELVSEELEDGSFDPALASDQLHRIRRAADRGVALIEDLLAYASIGSESLDIGAVDLTMLAQAVAAEHQAAADRLVHVKVEELPEVEGSMPLLRQLLSNLIGNAVKYTPADRDVRILVDTVVGRSSDWVTVRIADNANPIPATDRHRLFGMFQRGEHRDVPGNGVGLAICQRVAEAHGGRVMLDPDYTDGNRFCIELAGQASYLD